MTTQDLTYGFPLAWNLFKGSENSQVFQFRFYAQSLFEIRDFIEHARREGESGPFVTCYGPANGGPDTVFSHLDKTPIFGCPPPLAHELPDTYTAEEVESLKAEDGTPAEGYVLLLLKRRAYECGICGSRTEAPTFEHGFAICIAHGILHDFETEPREGSLCRPHVPEKTAEWPVPPPPDTLNLTEESPEAELFEPADVLEPASEEARAFIEGEHADPSGFPVEAAPTEPAPAPEEGKP